MSDTMHFPIVIVGAGGTGLTAALAAHDAGGEVLVLERDASPSGSTAMSTGMIPASGTPEQAVAGIVDTPEIFTADMVAKTKGRIDPELAMHVARESVETIAWLRDGHGVPLELVDGFIYPGHSVRRMYGTPNRTGGELMAALEAACAEAQIPILTEATVAEVLHHGDRVTGVRYIRPDGSAETVTCDALILACSGFAGNAEMVARFIPDMAEATFHGHPGNKGDAIRWGLEMGAAVADMTAYQGHGGLAVGHAVPILWPLIMEGGFQVNVEGRRFSDESAGYSEQAAKLNAQPGRVGWSIFDERLHVLMSDFDDYRDALRAGAVISAATLQDLAEVIKVPAIALEETCAEVAAIARGEREDAFGRAFAPSQVLAGPYFAAKVTGALFHTQGGLVIDTQSRVLHEDGTAFPNLFAGGGAARGLSGDGSYGYLAGNGLLAATTLGKIAGRAAVHCLASAVS
ncbi:FAD-dependent oxidoreductase [Novosphingobium guangzhouense]|uniref:3-ketosteroid dehydrogenase n=1 Tax=Novosphingobium guangzhouense TaxID=1850347 RepID=A0A2K2G6H5_9SPHN|nr:FAD-dependent oxidoreductase [Novosphingobium guangzhouense]PNU06641.1 3-ketosteroid dehydrogenase [Novosphingobium guangzhouense]